MAGVILGTVVLASSACSSQSLTVAEYAEAIEGATRDYISESQALSATFHKTVEDAVAHIVESGGDDPLIRATEVTVREMMLFFVLLEDAVARYLARLNAVEAPNRLRGSHAAYMGAVSSVHASMPALLSSIEFAHDLGAVQAAIAGSGFQDGQHRWTETCLSLESAVRGEGTGVDLGCTRSQETP